MKGRLQSCSPPFAYLHLSFLLLIRHGLFGHHRVEDDGEPEREKPWMNSLYGVSSLYLVPIPQIFLYCLCKTVSAAWRACEGQMTRDTIEYARVLATKREYSGLIITHRPCLLFAHLYDNAHSSVLSLSLSSSSFLSLFIFSEKKERRKREKKRERAWRNCYWCGPSWTPFHGLWDLPRSLNAKREDDSARCNSFLVYTNDLADPG